MQKLLICINFQFNNNEDCTEKIKQASYLTAYQMINYTQSTGNIKLLYNGSLADSNVCDYCNYINELNYKRGG